MQKYSALIPTYETKKHSKTLAVVHYKHEKSSITDENDILHVYIPFTSTPLTEYWYSLNIPTDSTNQTQCHATGTEGWCADGDNLFAACLVPDGPELAPASKQAYMRLIQLAEQLGYANIYRIWNYVGRINAPNNNGLERYRDFCLGRADAFEALKYAPTTLPAATGIGFQNGGVVVFLIARKAPQATNIENPLQVPAYQYPQRYGPKAPSFARATVIKVQNGFCLYVSGTASIRNYTSLTQNIEQEIAITIENIQQLLKTAATKYPTFKQSICDSLKIYVRHKKDIPLVSQAFQAAFGIEAAQAPVLISDICRAELSLEVEGVFRAP
ncbi:hypothetical protein ACF3NX_07310 [Acetobacter orientalis]|uniref:chorismate transformation enzyme, FkbO/Hyg5 family n=1 Tax=Acetobacter orientalis TaxID=146474 RepID=UPI0038648AF2